MELRTRIYTELFIRPRKEKEKHAQAKRNGRTEILIRQIGTANSRRKGSAQRVGSADSC